MISWIKHNKAEALQLFLILSLAVFLRFYRLADYMTFMGDEGRDALIVRDIVTGRSLPLIGAPTSVSTEAGSVHLGPMYYYMMALGMWLSGMNPVGAVVVVATIGVLAVALIYYLARVWFGREAALLTGLAYSISTVVVAYARTAWNPNPAPFFSMLAVLGIFKSFQTRNSRWLILTGIALGFAVQMHYLAMILLPVMGLLWLWFLYLRLCRKYSFRHFASGTITALASFLVLMSPLVLYDVRHGFSNFRAMKAILSGGASGIRLNPFANLSRVAPIYTQDLVGMYVAVGNVWVTGLMSVMALAPLIITLILKLRGKSVRGWPFLILAVWLMVGVVGLSLYNQELIPHYLGFLSPVPFLLLGGFIYYLPQKLKYPAVGLIVLLIALVNFPKNPLAYPPSYQPARTEQIAQFIIKLSENQPFNFALISEHNYDAAYRFYLERYGHSPASLPGEVTGQLLVVCEDAACDPALSASPQLAAFGASTKEQSYDLYGVRIFKLSHAETIEK